MKRKFIALLMAMVSVTSLFAACKEDEPPVVEPCTTHTDTDKNAVCDACGKDIIYIKDQVIQDPEQAVDMVVNPIPAEAVKSDYIKEVIFKEGAVLPTEEELFDIWSVKDENVEITNLNIQPTFSNLFKVSYTVVEWDKTNVENPVKVKETNHVVLYDAINKKELYHFESKTYTVTREEGTQYEYEDTYTDSGYINVLSYAGIYCVREDRYEKVERYDNYVEYEAKSTYSYFTLDGEVLYTGDTDANVSYTGSDSYYNIWFNETEYAIDKETNKLLYKAHEDVFVNRPRFDTVQGNYGYVYSYGGLYVYDLTKWIDCVYADPSISGTTCVLADGNVLVQDMVVLSDSAVSYDVFDNGVKYDIVQTIINPVEGTSEEVEFGYLINEFVSGADEEGAEFLVNAEHNAFVVTLIEGRMYSAKEMVLITDSKLNVLYGESLDNFDMRKVAEDLYLKDVNFGDGSSVEAIVNGKGELVTYLPDGYRYEDHNGFIMVDNTRVYNWKMELLLDLEKEEYAFHGMMDDTSMILSKWVEEDNTATTDIPDDKINVLYYYYYNPSVDKAPVKLGSKTETTTIAYFAMQSGEGGYYTMKKTVEEGVEKTTYLVYNANNALIGEFDSRVVSVYELSESGVYVVETQDDVTYFLR